MESVNVRNLEQIQEEDRSSRSSRLGALLLASLGGAALVTVALVMAKRSGPPARAEHDPLAELVKSAKNNSTPAEQLDGHDVTFPGILSDSRTPTTALAAVKDERGRLVEQPALDPAAAPSAPPPATDRLPVVPLPVGTLLSATPVTTDSERLADRHGALRLGAGRWRRAGFLAAWKAAISCKSRATASKPTPISLVEDLRKRGHHAFRQAAYVPERGLWQRVRIGPFKSKFEAAEYKAKFEKTERLVAVPGRPGQGETSRRTTRAAHRQSEEVPARGRDAAVVVGGRAALRARDRLLRFGLAASSSAGPPALRWEIAGACAVSSRRSAPYWQIAILYCQSRVTSTYFRACG